MKRGESVIGSKNRPQKGAVFSFKEKKKFL
jgi:hypothetical protein